LPDQLLTMAPPSSTADGQAKGWRGLERQRRQPRLASCRLAPSSVGPGQPVGRPRAGRPQHPLQGAWPWASGGGGGPDQRPRGAIATRCSRSGARPVVSDREARHRGRRRSVLPDQGQALTPRLVFPWPGLGTEVDAPVGAPSAVRGARQAGNTRSRCSGPRPNTALRNR
jgi:hypothetical protein